MLSGAGHWPRPRPRFHLDAVQRGNNRQHRARTRPAEKSWPMKGIASPPSGTKFSSRVLELQCPSRWGDPNSSIIRREVSGFLMPKLIAQQGALWVAALGAVLALLACGACRCASRPLRRGQDLGRLADCMPCHTAVMCKACADRRVRRSHSGGTGNLRVMISSATCTRESPGVASACTPAFPYPSCALAADVLVFKACIFSLPSVTTPRPRATSSSPNDGS